MITLSIRALILGLISIGMLGASAAPALDELFEERRNSVLVVEFFVETEVDRRPMTVNGIAVSSDGVVQLAANAIPGWGTASLNMANPNPTTPFT
jgi:hypothetical protein